jgi:hypothetical protein
MVNMTARFFTKKIEIKAVGTTYEKYVEKHGTQVLRYKFKTNEHLALEKGFIVYSPDERPVWVNKYDFRYRFMPIYSRGKFSEAVFFTKPLLVEVEDLTFSQYVERHPTPTNKYNLKCFDSGNDKGKYITHGNGALEWIRNHNFQKLYDKC